jgi:ABC-type thiamine transport system ATPase subunit
MDKVPFPLLLHAIVALALILSYTLLSITGNDASTLLGLLAGYLGGAGAQIGIDAARHTQPSPFE